MRADWVAKDCTLLAAVPRVRQSIGATGKGRRRRKKRFVRFHFTMSSRCSRRDEGSTLIYKESEEKIMEKRIANLMKGYVPYVLRFALAGSLLVPTPLLEAARAGHEHGGQVPAKLVQEVRDATRQFLNVNVAKAAGYGQFLGCVSGPDHGAMGIHYVNGAYVGDGLIDVTKPEALIYEPSNGQLKLVGVEFIVDATSWLASHNGQAPVLEGQSFQFVGTPNRYGIGSIFELHVWAWRDNPNGAFVDWNDDVTCDVQ